MRLLQVLARHIEQGILVARAVMDLLLLEDGSGVLARLLTLWCRIVVLELLAR